jgi:hypothetical protein
MRNLAIRGVEYIDKEKLALIDNCQPDVEALASLLPVMLLKIDSRIVIAGRYIKAAARLEFHGIPMDMTMLSLLRQNWKTIQQKLIDEINQDYGVFEGHTYLQSKAVCRMVGTKLSRGLLRCQAPLICLMAPFDRWHEPIQKSLHGRNFGYPSLRKR